MATLIIKPFLQKENDSIGLSEYGFAAFPGSKTYIEVPALYGKYLTGFDVDAFYLDKLDEKTREKERKAIKAKVGELNRKFPHFRLDEVRVPQKPDDESIKPNPFYANMVIELKSDMTVLDSNDPESLVKIEIIKTNAKYNPFFEIAPDLITARESNKEYKYYIVNADRDVEQEVSLKKEMNKATSTLDNLSSKDKEKFILVVKYLLPANKGYNSESEMRLYKRADDYINGNIDGEKVKGGDTFYKNFIKASEMDREELLAKVIIKYAILTNVVRLNTKSKDWEYSKTLQTLGKTPDEMYYYLTDAKNMELFKDIKTDVQEEVRII